MTAMPHANATTRTTCPYCGVGCGVLATPADDGRVEIAGDPAHPANFGRLCSKGSALGETLSLDDRLLTPLIDGVPAGWDAALDLVAARFTDAIAEHGPDSVAFYVSGQILTEDYYAANKLMKGFIGSANIDTNSRLCMASSVAGHKRAFGSDTVPGTYEDLEEADLVVLVGSNLAWCHPVLYQRLVAARQKRGTRIVVVDPRRTSTCDSADQHLALAPGSDVALFNGLLAHLAASNAVDAIYVSRHTSGMNDALGVARQSTLAEIAAVTELSTGDIETFYRAFTATPRVVTVYSQGVNQSSAGTDKVNAIINCHLITGRIGKPGMGPFSVTGQPNAMGGREVGGLANMLAAHMDLGNAEHRAIVQGFWQSPRIASAQGLKAVDLFEAVGDGRIKALWIMGTNPVDSMPDADRVRSALRVCPFVVVSDVMAATDTLALADVALPALAWGEKSGTVTNSERRISRQRAFLAAPGDARADWWQLAEVGRRMGFGDAFNWTGADEIFTEHARLSGAGNTGGRDFDISSKAALSAQEYDALDPFQWPAPAGPASTAQSPDGRMFSAGGFFTADRRARFVATPVRAPQSATTPRYPLILNTGRIRDQWHTTTRTAKSPRLMAHMAEPFAEIHPTDAARFAILPAHLVRVESERGSIVVRALITDRARPGSVFVPIHWTDQIASCARVDTLIGPHRDPISGQPELKFTPIAIRPYPAAWYAFAVSTRAIATDTADTWAVARADRGWRAELAGVEMLADWALAARTILQLADGVELAQIADTRTGRFGLTAWRGDAFVGALYVAVNPVGVARSWVTDQLGLTVTDAATRAGLLAGRPGAGVKDKGQIVCACLSVGRNEIIDAIVAGGCGTVDAISAKTGAGTNCGSCRADIRAVLDADRLAKAG